MEELYSWQKEFLKAILSNNKKAIFQIPRQCGRRTLFELIEKNRQVIAEAVNNDNN